MNSMKFPKLTNQDTLTSYNIKNLTNTLKRSTEHREEREAILEAIKIGYFLYPSRELIWDVFKQQVDYDEKRCKKLVRKTRHSKLLVTESLENDYTKIYYLNMSKVPLFEIGDLFLCRNLVILNLSNNFLMNIEALYDCVHLIRLDLQNNQISKLPSEEFWSRLSRLRVLFLHNNLIGRLEYLKYLAFCQSLEILTLYDSPISLKNNYRHHAVNSIITLKALDNYIISDEEIIEEAVFKNAFSAGSENFRINLSINSQENSFSSELSATRDLLKQVNKILAKNSPVLIIQRFTRGFLVRRKLYKTKMKAKIEAAIKIQQWWRKKKIILKKNKTQKRNKSAKDTSDYQNTNATASFSTDYRHKKKDTKRNNTPISIYPSKRNILLDLNKFNLSRQSTNLSLNKSHNFPNLNQRSQNTTQKSEQNSFREELITTIFRDTRFDSEKLVKISQMIANFNNQIDLTQIPQDINFEYISFLIDTISQKLKKQKEDTSKNDSIVSEPEYDSSDFRLPILKSNNDIIKTKDNYIVDLIKDKVRDINAIRVLDMDGHKKIDQIKRVEKIETEEFLTNDQRYFQKIYGNMTIGCLRAVDKAYEERNANDTKLTLQKKCQESREYEKTSRRQIAYYKEDCRKEIRENSVKKRAQLNEARTKSEKEFDELRKEVKEKRERMIQFKKNRRRDVLLAIEFSKQHISVSKALQKHEFLMKKESVLKEKSNFVLDYKTEMESQNDLVKKFIQQRINMRQVQILSEKRVIEDRIKIDKEFQAVRAQNRVRVLKSVEPIRYKALETYNYDFVPPDDENSNDEEIYTNGGVSNYRENSFLGRLATSDSPFRAVPPSIAN